MRMASAWPCPLPQCWRRGNAEFSIDLYAFCVLFCIVKRPRPGLGDENACRFPAETGPRPSWRALARESMNGKEAVARSHVIALPLSGISREGGWLRLLPAVTLAVFLLPVVAGLAGTLL